MRLRKNTDKRKDLVEEKKNVRTHRIEKMLNFIGIERNQWPEFCAVSTNFTSVANECRRKKKQKKNNIGNL